VFEIRVGEMLAFHKSCRSHVADTDVNIVRLYNLPETQYAEWTLFLFIAAIDRGPSLPRSPIKFIAPLERETMRC